MDIYKCPGYFKTPIYSYYQQVTQQRTWIKMYQGQVAEEQLIRNIWDVQIKNISVRFGLTRGLYYFNQEISF